MAYEIPRQSFTGIAAADLTGKEGFGVVLTAAGKIALAGAGVAIDGILRYAGKADETVTVVKTGQMGLIFGAAVTAGDPLATDANGKFVVAVAPAIGVARAMESGAADTKHKALLGGVAAAQYQVIAIPIKLPKVANGDIVTDYIPGFAGKIVSVKFLVTDPVTTGAKLATLGLEIEAAAVTGGVIALTSAACTPLGKVIAGSAITALNTFTAVNKISVVASATTAFVEGEGTLLIVVQQ